MSTLSIKQGLEGLGTFTVSVQPKDASLDKCSVTIKGLHLTNSFFYYFFKAISMFLGKMEQIQTTKREYVWIQNPQDTERRRLDDLTHEFESLRQGETFTNMQGVWGVYPTYTPKPR